MRLDKLNTMHKNWFIGAFEPNVFKTNDFEICYASHEKGEFQPAHYHKSATEITLITRGQVRLYHVQEHRWYLFKAGDIFTIYPNEIVQPQFPHEDCEVVVVKVPSCPDDKYIWRDGTTDFLTNWPMK